MNAPWYHTIRWHIERKLKWPLNVIRKSHQWKAYGTGWYSTGMLNSCFLSKFEMQFLSFELYLVFIFSMASAGQHVERRCCATSIHHITASWARIDVVDGDRSDKQANTFYLYHNCTPVFHMLGWVSVHVRCYLMPMPVWPLCHLLYNRLPECCSLTQITLTENPSRWLCDVIIYV